MPAWLQGASPLIIILSPLLVIGGILYQAGRLYWFRIRQRDALRRLCDEVLLLRHLLDIPEFQFRVRRLRLLADHFERALFGPRCPAGLVNQWINMAAILFEIERVAAGAPTTAQEQWIGHAMRPFEQKASDLRIEISFVLFTL